EARWVEARLFAEPSVELRAQLIRLLGRVGDTGSLARLVAPLPVVSGVGAPTSNLALLARSGEALIPALKDLITDLSQERPELRLRASYALAGAEEGPENDASDAAGEDPSRAALRLLRRRAGLDLLLSTDLAGVGDGPKRQAAEAWILKTAIQQRRTLAAPTAAFFASSDPAALRLREVVQNRVDAAQVDGDAEDLSMAQALLASALLRADLMVASAQAGVLPTSTAAQTLAVTEVLAQFDQAVVAAPLLGWSRADLTLESVAFLRVHGRSVQALQRLERLVMGEPLPAAADLSAETIRTFAALVADPEVEAIRTPGRIARASRLLMDMSRRASWRESSVDERLVDLERLVELRGLALANEVLLKAIDDSLTKLSEEPTLREELIAVDAERAAKLWASISTEDAVHEESSEDPADSEAADGGEVSEEATDAAGSSDSAVGDSAAGARGN
ncbi:MAG: hypothetical protein AAGG01_19185, partial [Planctomycetota bacterium]